MGCCQSINPKTQQPRTIRKNIDQINNNQQRQEQGGMYQKPGKELGKNGQKGQQKKNDDNDFNKLDEISFVIVDGNNLPQDMAKMVLNTENSKNYRLPSARNSSVRSSFVSNADNGIPLPSQLKNYQEILMLIINGDTQGTIEMIKKLKLREVVGVRGLSLQIDDIEFEKDSVETIMWNPLHFAVYYSNFDLVKFLIKELKINIGLTGPKAKADNERDQVNIADKYQEDRIQLVLLAYDRRNPQILKFLLDECCKFWPKYTIENLLSEKIGEEILALQETPQPEKNMVQIKQGWSQMITTILRSRTAHAFYGSLSFKKRCKWIYNFAYGWEKFKFSEIKRTYQQEFSLQPYAGFYLFFLLFEDHSDDIQHIQAVIKNVTNFDYILYLVVEDLDDPFEYFDANRILKIKDKFNNPDVGQLLDKIIIKLKEVASNYNPKETIKQSNLMLLELASQKSTTKQEFQDMINQVNSFDYLVQLQILQVKGYQNHVKLMRNLSNFDYIQQYQQQYRESTVNEEEDVTEKWNPVTFAIFNGNLELTKFLINTCICNTKKMLKVPGLFNTQLVNKLFPFISSIQNGNSEMFMYFWEELGFLWGEDTLENLFKILAKKDLTDYLSLLFRSRTAHTIFEAMSYHYRFAFIEHLIQQKHDLLEEINQMVLQGDDIPNGGVDPEEFLFEKKVSIDHYFMKVYEELSQQPYSIHFYLSFSKELIKEADPNQIEECLDFLRKTQKNIKDSDIELFLHYKTEVALQIVNDLIDEPSSNIMSGNMNSGMGPGGGGVMNQMTNAIDKETKNLAVRIKKSPNFKHYKQNFTGQKHQFNF